MSAIVLDKVIKRFGSVKAVEDVSFREVDAAERDARLAKTAELVGLAGHLDRKPQQRSGGQRQRDL